MQIPNHRCFLGFGSIIFLWLQKQRQADFLVVWSNLQPPFNPKDNSGPLLRRGLRQSISSELVLA